MISFDDFKKVEITVGKILSAEKVPETDKLLKLSVDFGIKTDSAPAPTAAVGAGALGQTLSTAVPVSERDIRQIISGIALHFPDPQALAGKKCMFVTNIPPRTIKGFESNGMILALSAEGGVFSLLEPNDSIPEGTRVK